MAYTVGEMAKRLDVPASTLRYYDKEGLLPFVARSPGGMRIFQDADLEWLKVIGCLKKAGMSIKNIRVYIELAMQGNETIDQRLELFRNQREVLRNRLAELQETNEKLAADIANSDDPELIEEIARDELGMVEPGEKIIRFGY